MDRMWSKKALIQKLLKGIETGDPEAATVVDDAEYSQHNSRTRKAARALRSHLRDWRGRTRA